MNFLLNCKARNFNLRSVKDHFKLISHHIQSGRASRVLPNGTARQPQGTVHPKKAAGGKRRKGSGMKLTIAIEGCCHGELDKIYATLQLLEQREGKKIDLLLCCGDFQAVRNLDDLETMACPPKYRSMQSFYKYYSGERVAPIPTIFIGGNHEAANHLWELYYGGWAAPNIYFLGFAGAVRFGGLRIAGLSGIYKQHDYMRGHHEALPYSESTMRSIYHVRDFEVYRLLQLRQPVDIFLSHDWPTNIARYGNTAQLLARKAFLRSEVESGSLGSPPAAQLLAALRPAFWFSAHLHTKFAALVQHSPTQPPPHASAGAADRPAAGAVAVGRGATSGDAEPTAGRPSGGFPTTRFLALDKCLPGRDFLQLIELDAPGPPGLHYDEEWLAVLRTTHHLTNLGFRHAPLPGMGALRSGPRPEDLEFVRRALAVRGSTRIPDNFEITSEPYIPAAAAAGQRRGRMPQRHERNPQTVALLDILGLPYNLDHTAAAGRPPTGPGTATTAAAAATVTAAAAAAAAAAGNGVGARASGRAPVSLASTGTAVQPPPPRAAPLPLAPNPEEIELGDLEDDEEEQPPQEKRKEPGVGGPDASAGGREQSGEGEAAGGGAEQAASGGGAADPGGPADDAFQSDPMFQPLQL